MQEAHSCEAVVLHCIDFRFTDDLDKHLIGRFPQGYDLISLAGSCKGLLSDEDHRKILLEQFQISNRLHHPGTIVLIQHEDCGAYGGSKNFGDSISEQEFQKGELEKAAQLLAQNFPGIRIERYFAKLSKEVVAL
ncbi:MAG: hypothetical protein Q8P12_06460 [bacterium]|nr:hypothetical protein [bacterium]